MDEAEPGEESTSQPAAMIPTPEVRAEIEEMIVSDTSLLGEVYRNLRARMRSEQIQESRGAATSGFVWT